MPDVGKDEDFSCRRIDIANDWFEMPEETPPSAYPVDTAWENMPEVGLERWPDGEQEPNRSIQKR